MERAHKKGHEVIMMIDSKMFNNKVSYSYADILNDTHWIVYEGDLKFSDKDGKEALSIDKSSFLNFKVFTWGEDPQLRIRISNLEVESFKSTFYGYIECYNDYKKTKEDIIQEAIIQSKMRDISDIFPRF